MSLENRAVVAHSLLKHSGIRIERVGGKSVFVIPEGLAQLLKQEYNFSFEQLRVGGDLPLHDLALHMDEHASLEAQASMATEQARQLKEQEKIEYDAWYNAKANRVRTWWYEAYNKWPTEGAIAGRIHAKYGKELKQKQKHLADLESSYRILNNVIRSAITVKGDMLRSMRPLLQSDGSIFPGIDAKIAKKVRAKLIVTKGEKSGKERKEKQRKEKRRKETK